MHVKSFIEQVPERFVYKTTVSQNFDPCHISATRISTPKRLAVCITNHSNYDHPLYFSQGCQFNSRPEESQDGAGIVRPGVNLIKLSDDVAK
jgi:hypothetical protein